MKDREVNGASSSSGSIGQVVEGPDPDREFARRTAWAIAGQLAEDPEIKRLIESTEREIAARASRRRYIRPAQWLLAAASCAAIAWALWFIVLPAPENVYATGIGEQRTLVLEDGSEVMLNTNTAISVAFDRDLRSIELEQGEATFTVRPDPERPFEVSASSGVARALGTSFNVLRLDGRVEVSVLEGRVKVDGRGSGGVPVDVELGAGQATRYGTAVEGAGAVYPANLSRITAWQENEIEFEDMSLADALEEYNRYTTVRLTLEDPAASEIRVSGRFRIGEPENFVKALQLAYGLDVVRSGDEMILSPAE